MKVTASKKPSAGGRIGAIWPPASVAIPLGWKFGLAWFEQAAVETPGSTLVRTLGKRPLFAYVATLACRAVPAAPPVTPMFHTTPAPICVVPLSTCPVVAVLVVSIWGPTVLKPVIRK